MRPTNLGNDHAARPRPRRRRRGGGQGLHTQPRIVGWLQRVGKWADKDEVPWCSAFVDEIAHRGGCCATKSLRARSWLQVGIGLSLDDAEPGMDIVIFNRGGPDDPTVINAPGHVGILRLMIRLDLCRPCSAAIRVTECATLGILDETYLASDAYTESKGGRHIMRRLIFAAMCSSACSAVGAAGSRHRPSRDSSIRRSTCRSTCRAWTRSETTAPTSCFRTSRSGPDCR